MRTVPTTVTYLESLAPPGHPPALAPEPDVRVRRLATPRAEEYLALYDRCGRDLTWTARKLMPRAQLQAILDHPAVEVHVIETAAGVAGYVELDGRKPAEVEIAYLGLFPEARGRRLGSFLLDWAVRRAWAEAGTRRVWLHTCTLDDPRALPLYRRGGFAQYATADEQVALID